MNTTKTENCIERALMSSNELNLNYKGLTTSLNGYPEPDLGYFFYGFDTLEQANSFAEENNGTVCNAEWKDGWGYATYKGTYVFEDGYDLAKFAENETPNCHIYYSKNAVLAELEQQKEMYADNYDNQDENGNVIGEPDLSYITKELDKINWETQFLIIDLCDLWAERRDHYGMMYSHDTKNYAIGVHIPLNQ